MSKEYDIYLKEHRENVAKGFYWLEKNIPELFENLPKDVDVMQQIVFAHDHSKDAPNEYEAYDNWFYGNQSYAAKQAFEEAWLIHIHNNPHHWQHWVLIFDDPDEPTTYIPIPLEYIIEMICDWWAFSWKDGNLYEIFDWYTKHAPHIQMNDESREQVEHILQKIKDKLDYNNTLRCVLEEDR